MQKYIEVDGEVWRLSNGYYRRHITIFLHRYMWEKHFGPIPEGHHIHHKDGNKTNNAIENLECLEASEHHKRTWVENYDRMHKITSANLVKYERQPKHRQRMSEWSKQYWKENKGTFLTCEFCKKEYRSTQPKLSKRCRKCQKEAHYSENQEQRECIMCYRKFQCYKYSKTFTCCQSCAVKHAWKTKRKVNDGISCKQSDR